MGHTDQARAVAWSPNSKYMASAGADMTVRVWEAATGQTKYIYYGHMGFLQQFFSVQAQEPPPRRLAAHSLQA